MYVGYVRMCLDGVDTESCGYGNVSNEHYGNSTAYGTVPVRYRTHTLLFC